MSNVMIKGNVGYVDKKLTLVQELAQYKALNIIHITLK